MTTPIILRDFRFTRDFRQIQWGATIWYNLLRAACAGIVIGIIMFFFPDVVEAPNRYVAFAVPLVYPVAYLIYMPFFIFISLFQGIPLIGGFIRLFVALAALIMVAIGDPIVCILHKISPKIVPVNSPPFFSLYFIFWVLSAPEIAVTN